MKLNEMLMISEGTKHLTFAHLFLPVYLSVNQVKFLPRQLFPPVDNLSETCFE